MDPPFGSGKSTHSWGRRLLSAGLEGWWWDDIAGAAIEYGKYCE